MMLTNCCVLFTGYAWSHVMCSAGAISALLFPLVCALCLHSECHFFLCSCFEMACTLFFFFFLFLFFFLHTCTHTNKQYRCWHVQVAPRHTPTTHSTLLWRLAAHYDEAPVRSLEMVSFWSRSGGKTLVLCSMCAVSCFATVAVQQCSTSRLCSGSSSQGGLLIF